MIFVTGRGRKVHMADPARASSHTLCGRRWDKQVDTRFVDRDEFCSNCMRTGRYAALGQRKPFDVIVEHPPEPPVPGATPTGV